MSELTEYMKACKRILQQDRPKQPAEWDGISYVNWWDGAAEEMWFSRFLSHRLPDRTKNVRFYSVFGPRRRLHDGFRGARIFYSGENVEPGRLCKNVRMNRRSALYFYGHRVRTYGDYALPLMDLSLGFGHRTEDNYLRFPEWIPFTFEPESGPREVRERVAQINAAMPRSDAAGALLLASHDDFGTRTSIADGLTGILDITYGGKFRNNSNALKTRFEDDKLRYLRTFRFNICPENTDTEGYCTEKLFDSFRTGTIPVYNGSHNDPEPGLVNRDAVVFWDFDGDNAESIRLIRELDADDRKRERFLKQTRLTDAAADYVCEELEQLKERIRALT
ncbi:MAG: glycosyltransferase family 10 [Lachnospiraceae bacterium]|jgi:hypothetical protein|nr:glycosyltransferase family 10 [Lachnospiraceae bacterium]